jgi:hypothetical protein
VSAGLRSGLLSTQSTTWLGLWFSFPLWCDAEESFALLSGEADLGVEGVVWPPMPPNFGASLGFGLSFEGFESLRGRLGC